MHGDSAHCPSFLHSCTMEGWVDTLACLDDGDEDGTYDHLDLALDGHDTTDV